MSYLGDGIAALALSVTTFATRRKMKLSRDEKRAAKTAAYISVQVEKLDEMRELQRNVEWIMKQFGESPNGGGIMEQLLRFIETTNGEFASIRKDNQRHLEWHMEASK